MFVCNESRGARQRAIDVAFRRQMHDSVRPKIGKRMRQCGAIADVGFQKAIVRSIVNGCQRSRIAGVGQLVDVENLDTDIAYEITDERRSDEACSSGYKGSHGRLKARLRQVPEAPYPSRIGAAESLSAIARR